MTALFVFHSVAEADLREVVRYTRKQWGIAQTRIYTAKLHVCIEGLAKGEGHYKDMSALYQGLRMVLCQHHYIFCLPRPNEPALIVAILHERMDVMARLKNRLK